MRIQTVVAATKLIGDEGGIVVRLCIFNFLTLQEFRNVVIIALPT